jgi:hypothetical protein
LTNRAEKDKTGQETLEAEINNFVSQPRNGRSYAEESAAIDFFHN